MGIHIDRENVDATRKAEIGAVAGTTGAVVAVGSGASGFLEIAVVTFLVAVFLGYGILLTVMVERN